MRDWWDRASIFWKAYLLFVLFVGGIVTAGEFFEDVLGRVFDAAHGLSDLNETYVWIVATIIPTAFGSYLMTRLFTDPLQRFTAATTRLAEGDMQTRMDAKDVLRGDEIGMLARAFNHMAERLEHEFANEHRLLAAISHELRSPLTRLSVTVALLRRQAADEQYLQRLELETERMNALITQLLDYTRREMEEPRPEQIDLCVLVRDVASDASFEGNADNKTLHLAIPESAIVSGNSILLRQAVDNVVRNALRYSPSGGCVDISLTLPSGKHADACTLVVRDHGPGVPEAMLHDLFRPFFVVDATRDRRNGGTGMGLCLVEQAVRLHHGQIRAVNAAGGGLEVSMRFPGLCA
ncbi:MAG: ATP-binding protein [Bilophila sp.]